MKGYLLIFLIVAYVSFATSENRPKISYNKNEPDDIVTVLPTEETEEEEFEKLCGNETIDMSQKGLRNLTAETFENIPNIKCLNLEGNKISNIPEELFRSKNLENLLYLNLSDNSLIIEKQQFINYHKNLKTLVLDGNTGKTYYEDTFYITQLPENLETLYIRNNTLTIMFSWDFYVSSNSKLKKLYLSNNLIGSIYDRYMIRNSSLQYVHMEGNGLTVLPELLILNSLTHLYFDNGFAPYEICLFTNPDSNLRVLSFRNCELKNLVSTCPLEFPLKFLTTLDVSRNNLNVSLLTHELLPSLQNLSLSHNPLYSVPENLANFTTLKVLSLSYCRITEVPSSVFEKLTSLEILSLRGNQITKIDFALNLPNLRILDLAENQLHSLPINWSSKLHSLEYLNLNSNSFPSLEALNLGNQLELKNLKDLHLRNNTISNVTIVPLDFTSELTIHVGPIL